MRKANNGKGAAGGWHGGAREGEPSRHARVERLRQSFARFRREHPLRTRIPDGLRNAALTAIENGASEAEVRRACGVTSDQLAQWRNRREGRRRPGGPRPVVAEPRIFPVVDDKAVVSKIAGGVQDLELRFGGWSICIRQVEG